MLRIKIYLHRFNVISQVIMSGTIICYIHTIGIVSVYACTVCDALVPSCATTANVHETKWTPHVKRERDAAQ